MSPVFRGFFGQRTLTLERMRIGTTLPRPICARHEYIYESEQGDGFSRVAYRYILMKVLMG